MKALSIKRKYFVNKIAFKQLKATLCTINSWLFLFAKYLQPQILPGNTYIIVEIITCFSRFYWFISSDTCQNLHPPVSARILARFVSLYVLCYRKFRCWCQNIKILNCVKGDAPVKYIGRRITAKFWINWKHVKQKCYSILSKLLFNEVVMKSYFYLYNFFQDLVFICVRKELAGEVIPFLTLPVTHFT